MTSIRNVAITANGAWTDQISGEETPEDCSRFRLNQSDVRSFFRKARRASFKEYVHDLDMSRCHATGQVTFSNGDRGEWHIDRERRGMIALSDGRNLYFLCSNCQDAHFYPR
jgi:hypothetical protein